MHVATIDLPPPAVAYFDLAIPGRRAVADHEVISQPVLHVTDVAMVVIENARIALSRSAVVDNDELPSRISPVSRCPIYFGAHRRGEKARPRAAAAASFVTVEEPIPKAGPLFGPAFLDRKLRCVARNGIVRYI